MRNKPLELTLYAAGAGAFGVFLRWLENQLAFNEEGLADPSAFHVIVPLFLIACVATFWHFQQEIERKHYATSPELGTALFSDLQLHTGLSILAGFVMVLGGLLLFAKSETDPFVGMLRVLAALAIFSGIAFPLVLLEARRERPRLGMLCPLMLLPLLMYAVWLILSYRSNAINSVHLAFGMDMLTAIIGMIASFRMAGFAFGAAKPKRAVFSVMLCASICIMSLADERYLGMQLILLGTSGEMLLYNWILLQNLEQQQRKVVVREDDGFEHL